MAWSGARTHSHAAGSIACKYKPSCSLQGCANGIASSLPGMIDGPSWGFQPVQAQVIDNVVEVLPKSSDNRRRMCGMRGDVGIQKPCTRPRMSGRYLRTCWRRKDTSTVSCWNKNSLRVSSLPLMTPNSTGITCVSARPLLMFGVERWLQVSEISSPQLF